EALNKIKSLDSMEELLVRVHTNVDIDELIKNTDGKIDIEGEKGKPLKKLRKKPKKEDIEKEEEVEEVKKEIQRKTVEKELKEKEIEEKEMGVYDLLAKEGSGKKKIVGEEEKYSFHNFVVGPNNKFAFAASKEVARFPGERYNPLFITSSAGLGKTHLLKSIYNYIKKNHEGSNVEYITTAKFSSDLSQAISSGEVRELRENYEKIDVFLIDDIQFLAGRDEVQEEIFYLFNEIKDRGGQIVLTCDRAPDKIPSIEDRLISRFKSGLIVDIQAPGLETRLHIVGNILEENETVLSEEIQRYIAENVTTNVRELEGALNRILAFSTLLKQDITLESVRETIKHHVGAEEKKSKMKEPKVNFLPGRSYLLEGDAIEGGFEVLKGISEKGRRLFIFSRMNPLRIKKDFDLEEAEIYWLTGRESEGINTVSPNLEALTWQLEELISKNSVVFLDGLEYLISNTNFDACIQFVRHIIDSISETDTILLITISPGALEKRQVRILEREMEVVEI
ncbi:MAG: DnaA/Hda family protein, partial [Thermoplasmata archaeon]